MVKSGDTVRYLSEVGGGTVVRVDGKIAYVDDDGFERPVATSELVVVLPAGHKQGGAKLMFDQQAYDTGRTSKRNKPEPPAEAVTPKQEAAPAATPEPEDFPIEETDYGDAMSVVIAFEPDNIKQLDSTRFNVALVNDSNYFLNYQLLVGAATPGEWNVFASGTAAPNEIVDLKKISRDDLPALERIVFQAIAAKHDRSFSVKDPVSCSRKIDLTKFFKLHCFSPGLYFETPVLEIPIVAEKIRHPKKDKNERKNKYIN